MSRNKAKSTDAVETAEKDVVVEPAPTNPEDIVALVDAESDSTEGVDAVDKPVAVAAVTPASEGAALKEVTCPEDLRVVMPGGASVVQFEANVTRTVQPRIALAAQAAASEAGIFIDVK